MVTLPYSYGADDVIHNDALVVHGVKGKRCVGLGFD